MEKTMTKAERVREALNGGATAKEAAALSGATLQYVYDLKSDMNREKGIPKRRGRPPKVLVSPNVPATLEIKSPKSPKSSKEGKPMIDLMVFENLVQEADKLEEEVMALRGIVSYLESKLVKHGFAV
jgi:hypothetical protein